MNLSIVNDWYKPSAHYLAQAWKMLRSAPSTYALFLMLTMVSYAVILLMNYSAWDSFAQKSDDWRVTAFATLLYLMSHCLSFVVWASFQRGLTRSVLLKTPLQFDAIQNIFSKMVWRYILKILFLFIKVTTPFIVLIVIIHSITGLDALKANRLVYHGVSGIICNVIAYYFLSRQMLALCFMHLQPNVTYSPEFKLNKRDQRLSLAFLIIPSQLISITLTYLKPAENLNEAGSAFLATLLSFPLWLVSYLAAALLLRDIVRRKESMKASVTETRTPQCIVLDAYLTKC